MDMKQKVGKIKSLQRRLRTASQSHMANRQNDAKDLYFGMLGYDIAA